MFVKTLEKNELDNVATISKEVTMSKGVVDGESGESGELFFFAIPT